MSRRGSPRSVTTYISWPAKVLVQEKQESVCIWTSKAPPSPPRVDALSISKLRTPLNAFACRYSPTRKSGNLSPRNYDGTMEETLQHEGSRPPPSPR